MAEKIGFIGLGAMGYSMARNLNVAGLLHCVWNRTVSTANAFSAESGVEAVVSVSAIAARCQLIMLCVSADDDVLQVIDNMVDNLTAGALVVDCSTVSVQTAKEASARLAAIGCFFMDAPVSGGTEGAKNGSLVIMAGGNNRDFERLSAVFSAIGSRAVLMGDVGSGQATKAVNQLAAAGITQAVTEAMAFAGSMNLPMDKVIDVVGSGAAGSWFLQHRGASMVSGSFTPGFRVRLHHKDLKICQAIAQQRGITLAAAESSLADYDVLIEQGFGDEDISSLYRLKKIAFKG